MSVEVGKIHLSLGIDTQKAKKTLAVFSKEANSHAKGIASAFSGIGTAVAAGLSIRAVVSFAKECINLGSDLAEVQNVVDVTFGDGAETINSWAKTTQKAFGLSELSAKQYSGTMGAMLKSTGIANGAAQEMSMTLAELAGDMASFYNLQTDEAFAKIRAGISGETEPLKQLGINLSVANLEAYALSQGITKSYNAMSQAEQVLLRYNYLMKTTSDAQGDFSRTAGSWANQVRVLQLNMESLKATLGQAFINVLTPCLQMLNEILSKLQLVGQAILDLSVMLFGDAGGASAGSSAAVTASEAIADNAASAAGSAKSYAKALAGFDKLNILGSSKKDSGGSSSGGEAGSIIPTVRKPAAGATSGYDTAAMQNKLGEIAGIVGVASLALGAILTFTGVNIPLGVTLMAIGAASLFTAKKIDEKAIETPVVTGLDLVSGVLSGALLALGGILCFSAVNIPLGIALMAVGAAGLATVAATNWDAATNHVKTAITGVGAAAGAAVFALGAMFTFSGAAPVLGIGMMIAGAAALGSSVALNWNSMSEGVGEAVTSVGAIVGGALLGLGAVLAFTGAGLPVGLALMAAGAVSLASAIAPNWDGISEKTKSTIGVISGIAGAALLVLGVILLFSGAGIPLGLGLIAAGGASLASAIAPNWDSIVNKIKTACSNIKQAFTNAWTSVKDGFRNMVNGIIGFANRWIDRLNKLLSPIAGLIVSISSAFGKKISISNVRIPNIPALANGGYVKANTPQLAIIGDNKREGEIVAPESKITDAVYAANGPLIAEIRALIAAVSRMGAGSGSQQINLNIDSKTLFEWFVKYHNSVVRQTGKSPLRI